jgi:hypothetical protein
LPGLIRLVLPPHFLVLLILPPHFLVPLVLLLLWDFLPVVLPVADKQLVTIPLKLDFVASPDPSQSLSNLYSAVSGSCHAIGNVKWTDLPTILSIPLTAQILPNKVGRREEEEGKRSKGERGRRKRTYDFAFTRKLFRIWFWPYHVSRKKDLPNFGQFFLFRGT